MQKQSPPGPPQLPPPERRQMTVVFIDIADSTSLSERLDPEEFFSVLREYRDICDRLIQRYGGVIARTVGDGLLAYFGLPQAHADDPENAALAGLAIIAVMRKHEFATSEIGPVRLGVRIGINTGLVVVGSLTGEPGIERRDVFGTPANIAARLQGTAPLNGVIIGPATHDLVKGAFRCTRLGEQQIKGVKKPIAVWRVDGIARTEGRFEKSRTAPLTPMIGRAAECSRLVDLWQQAVAGSGSVVVVSGGRGIGKSRLIQALRVAVAGVEKETLHFQCSPLQVNTPLAPLIERDRQQAGIEQDDSPEEMVAKLQAILAVATADTQTPISYYGALHSIPACTGYTPANLSKPKELERALQVITDVVTSLSRRRPVLIIIEDVQWIDPTSVSLLERLMARIDRERLLLVVSHNEEIDPYWLAERKALSIPLAKLEPRECERMVQAVAGEVVLPRGVVRSILDRADGVPLYIEACTRSVLVTAAQQGPGGRRVSSALLKEPIVPPSLHDAIMERLDHLGEARRIAQVASVFGRQFDFMGLRHIADMPKRSLAAALQSLEKAGLLTRQRKSPGNIFIFKHAMIQEVAYGSLLKETRTELHARAVARLRQVDVGSGGSRLAVLGYHYSRAGLLAEAVGAWLDAGKEALSRSANREAIANLWEGLELVAKLPSAEERHQLELVLQAHLGMAYTAMVGWAGPQVDQPYNRALELCRSYGTAREKAIVLWGVTIAALVNSQLQKALEFANEFVGLAEQWDDEEALLMANATAVLANFFCGRLEPARAAARLVCERYDKDVHGSLVQKCQHDPKVVALVYLGHIEWLLGNPHEAKAACEAARQLARELGHPFMLAFALILGSLRPPLRARSHGEPGERGGGRAARQGPWPHPLRLVRPVVGDPSAGRQGWGRAQQPLRAAEDVARQPLLPAGTALSDPPGGRARAHGPGGEGALARAGGAGTDAAHGRAMVRARGLPRQRRPGVIPARCRSGRRRSLLPALAQLRAQPRSRRLGAASGRQLRALSQAARSGGQGPQPSDGDQGQVPSLDHIHRSARGGHPAGGAGRGPSAAQGQALTTGAHSPSGRRTRRGPPREMPKNS